MGTVLACLPTRNERVIDTQADRVLNGWRYLDFNGDGGVGIVRLAGKDHLSAALLHIVRNGKPGARSQTDAARCKRATFCQTCTARRCTDPVSETDKTPERQGQLRIVSCDPDPGSDLRRDAPSSEPPADRDPQLTAAEIRGRLRVLSRESYLLLYSLMKSVSVAAAVVAVAQFVAAGGSAWGPRLAFWVASFTGLVLTYHAAIVGSVLHELRLSIADSALPLVLAAIEAAMFLVLGNDAEQGGIPTVWYLIYAGWAATAAAIIWRVGYHVQEQAEFGATDARPAFDGYARHLRADLAAATATAGVALAVWLAKGAGALNELGSWEATLGILATLGLCKGLRNQAAALETARAAVGARSGERRARFAWWRVPSRNGGHEPVQVPPE